MVTIGFSDVIIYNEDKSESLHFDIDIHINDEGMCAGVDLTSDSNYKVKLKELEFLALVPGAVEFLKEAMEQAATKSS